MPAASNAASAAATLPWPGIVAVGAIISDIPMVDGVPIEAIRTGDHVRVEGNRIAVWAAESSRSGVSDE